MNNKTSFFGSMLTVMRKEWVDFYRDRRTFLLSLLVAPLIYPLIFLGIGKLSEMRAETQLEKDLSLPVVGMEHAPTLVALLRSYGIEAEKAPADIEDRIRAQQEDLALVIDKDFAEDWRAGRPAKVDLVTDTPAAMPMSPWRAWKRCWKAMAMSWAACACWCAGWIPASLPRSTWAPATWRRQKPSAAPSCR